MAILPIIETPDPRLRVISKPVETFDAALHTACVKAGAYALAHRVIRALPLATPFLAPSLRKNLSGNTPGTYFIVVLQGEQTLSSQILLLPSF